MKKLFLLSMALCFCTLSVMAQYGLDVDGQVNLERQDNLTQRVRILTQGANAESMLQLGTGGGVDVLLGWDGGNDNFFMLPGLASGFTGFNMKKHVDGTSSPINFGFGTQSTVEDKVLIFKNSELGEPQLNLREAGSTDFARLQFSSSSYDDQWTIAAGLGGLDDPLMHIVHRPDVNTVATRILTIDGNDKRLGVWDNNPNRSLSVNYESITTSIWEGDEGFGLKNVGTAEGGSDDYEWLFYVKGAEFVGDEGDLMLLSNIIDSPANGENHSRGVFDNDSGVYAAVSDKSLKKNIKYLAKNRVDILNKIQQLKPATYQFKHQSDDRNHLGLIAQEVKEVFPEVVHSITEDPTKELWGVSYASLVPVLIAGMQEQQEDLVAKDQNIEALKDEVHELKQEMAAIRALLMGTETEEKVENNLPTTTAVLQKDYLLQNTPNPVHTITTIRYELPENAAHAMLQITDVQGKLVKNIALENEAHGQVELHKGTLGAGIYTYSLWIDGQVVDSKKMVLTK